MRVNVKYINPFIEATQNVMKEFIGLEATPGSPTLYDKNSNAYDWDISGIIGLAGQVLGVIIISFPSRIAVKMVAKMLNDENIKSIDDSVIDVIGELVNIIAGNAKKSLEQFKIAISLPSIVKGSRHQLTSQKNITMVNIPFSCELGNFNLLVSLKDLL